MPHSKLMVVEDDVHVAAVLETRLRTFGYEVCSIAPSGAAAVRGALAHRPDLILMDIMLEGDMNGIEAAEFIHSIMDVPIVFITCLNDQKMLDRAINANVYGFIRKPYDIAELKYTIQIALSHRQAAIERKRIRGNSNLIGNVCKEEKRAGATVQLRNEKKRVTRGENGDTKFIDDDDRAKKAHRGDFDEALSGIQLLLSLMLKSNKKESATMVKNEVANSDSLANQGDHEDNKSSLKVPRKGIKLYWDKMKDRISRSRLSFSP